MIKAGFEIFSKNPVFGIGIYANRDFLYERGIPYLAIHCDFLEVLNGIGLLGFVSYYYIYFYSLKPTFKIKGFSTNFLICIVLIMLLINATGTTYYTQRFSLFLIFTTIISDSFNKKVMCFEYKPLTEALEGTTC